MKMEKKTLGELLNSYHFVVPEIQREYVWGTDKNRHVLGQFVKDLGGKLQKGKANIGFLYSYVSGREHYLIDGQQRFTTMLLMLYSLSLKSGEMVYKSFVESLRLDDNLQAFSYRVRTLTESFLKNLIKSGISVAEKIMDETWFKSEYLNDPTIEGMLGALKVLAENVDQYEALTFENVLNNVEFWYFDVEMTSQGEELYITMNSRGEKLTDSEQIKPRLLGKLPNTDKERYGKLWDDWEEFFFKKSLRGKRGIGCIDVAMNNMIRVVLELETQGEHDHIRPVEDANCINLTQIESFMNALMKLMDLSDGRYQSEIVRLYGDSNSDGNFYVLKALLVEVLKGQEDLREYERVYQTTINQVRRNLLKNVAFLNFINRYRASRLGWYLFIREDSTTDSQAVFSGHELEKITLCQLHGEEAENAIWEEQAKSIWNGDIEQLLTWSKSESRVNITEFYRIRALFDLLFDQSENMGWTSDKVRQALLAFQLPNYPLSRSLFGYSSNEWKSIMRKNSAGMLLFLNHFQGMSREQRDVELEKIKTESEENEWSEFVHHDCLLDYCNTKRIYYREAFGKECVKNSFAKPYSVKNMILNNYLEEHLAEVKSIDPDWGLWVDLSGWQSVIKLYNNTRHFSFHIFYRESPGPCFVILLHCHQETDSEANIALKFGNEFQEKPCATADEKTQFVCDTKKTNQEVLESLKRWIQQYKPLK